MYVITILFIIINTKLLNTRCLVFIQISYSIIIWFLKDMVCQKKKKTL